MLRHYYVIITEQKSCNNDGIITCYVNGMPLLLRHYYALFFIIIILSTYLIHAPICNYMNKYAEICNLCLCTVSYQSMQCLYAAYAEICNIYAIYIQIYGLNMQ